MAERIRPEVAVLVGRRIRALRSAAGQSVAGLAERSEVSRRMLTQIELGQANPSLGTVDRIAAALGTTFAALVGMIGAPSPDALKVWSTPHGSWAYLLKASETSHVSVELWKWHIAGDDSYRVTPTPGAPDTMVHVSHGVLRVRSAATALLAKEDESAAIPGGAPYAFEADSEAVDFLSVVMITREDG
ncbi:transcriptional regulator, XRE family with cupin sensor [Streptomyces zhaozhouensis]|uniref:Transcriptional regulator, XRE family with cupin sensor n=1 Tax=Streptomyces zhaozhouensis TaxID=1300267 RepID=A0A286E0M8_9ACTN|nr:helix-turn-helix transcriptional regulator [Streptomyces zhaozhouensis]SOD64420.1 transcriptional regulator, XRE family with cupin sensor [Streptomyces zhaozhouensis]